MKSDRAREQAWRCATTGPISNLIGVLFFVLLGFARADGGKPGAFVVFFLYTARSGCEKTSKTRAHTRAQAAEPPCVRSVGSRQLRRNRTEWAVSSDVSFAVSLAAQIIKLFFFFSALSISFLAWRLAGWLGSLDVPRCAARVSISLWSSVQCVWSPLAVDPENID